MKKLDEIRNEISAIDRQMGQLFEKRMHLCSEVLSCKKECGLPVFDAEREAAILSDSISNLSDADLKEYNILFFKSLMDISKLYQQRLQSSFTQPK